MADGTKPLLERTLLALLLIQLKGMPSDAAAEILIRAGWSNSDAGEVLNTTANAISIRRSRMKKGR